LHLAVSDEEIARRLAVRQARPAAPTMGSGYQQLYIDRVLQADEGCDFDFLVGSRGSAVPKHSH
jgi:dihydroxyacid dehydratase/phosphogluconate dehydratase